MTAPMYRLLGGALQLAEHVVPRSLLPKVTPEALIAAAHANPDACAREGLAQLLGAIAADSPLSFFGRLSLRWDMIRLLRNAQLVQQAHQLRPELAATPIRAPIFILGLPRSGTSFLHALMAQDDANQVPRCWQTIYPRPRPAGFNPAQDRAARTVDAQLKTFAGLAPDFAKLHPIHADSPQECSEITAQVFQSLRFDTNFRVPGYNRWIEQRGYLEAFAYHRRFLQFLQNGEAARWVLKCPEHVFSLAAILQTYPDARFVLVHRDPVCVLGSVARLTEVLRAPFMKQIDPVEIAEQVRTCWIEGANQLLRFDARQDIPAHRKFHVHYDELTSAPLATVERLYAHFGLALSAPAQAAMSRQLAARPHGGYARHAPYSLDSFKLNSQALQAQFAPYIRRYCQGRVSSGVA